MISIVAFDPASIVWAGQQGELGYDHLTGVLECLLQNCFIAETSGWQVGAELNRAVKSLPESGTRKRVSTLIETSRPSGRQSSNRRGTRKRVSTLIETLCSPGRNRLTPVIDDTESGDAEIGQLLAAQVNHPELDAIVTETPISSVGRVEACKLAGFNQSNFARERSRRGCSVSFAPRSQEAAALFRDYFRKLLMMGDRLTMVDYAIGRFGDSSGNYSAALPHWCRFLNELEQRMEWIIHTENGQHRWIQNFVESELGDSLVTFKVVGHIADALPHERYLRCAGICIDIGRGIDLFDRQGLIRDVRLGLGNDQQFCKEYPHLA